MSPDIQPLFDSATLHFPTQSGRSLQWPDELQQPSMRAQQQPSNVQKRPLDSVSPTIGEDLLDSLGEPSVPGWSLATEQGEQRGTLVGDEIEMQAAMTGNAGTLP